MYTQVLEANYEVYTLTFSYGFDTNHIYTLLIEEDKQAVIKFSTQNKNKKIINYKNIC